MPPRPSRLPQPTPHPTTAEHTVPQRTAPQRTAGRARSRALPRLRATVAATLVAALGLTACSDEEAVPVRVEQVVRGDVVEIVEAPGTIVPRASATVTAPATGTVASVAVTEGQHVQAGQELLVLDSPQARQALQRAEAADAQAARSAAAPAPAGGDTTAERRRAREEALRGFAEARGRAEQIPDEAARTQALAALDAARAQYDLLSAQAEQLAEQVEQGLAGVGAALASLGQAQRVQTRAAVDAAQRVVDSLVVRAPISGVVSLNPTGAGAAAAGAGLPPGAAELLAAGGLPPAAAGAGGGSSTGTALTPGAPVSAGAALAVLTDASELQITAAVDETDVLQVRPATAADVSLDAVPDARYAATVLSIDPEPTAGGAGAVTFTARMSFDGGTLPDGAPAPAPLPGMSAIVALRVREAPAALRVPAAAVLRADAGRGEAVWVVADGRVQRRDVTVGARGEETVEVVEGLREGESVAVSGLDRLREGAELP